MTMQEKEIKREDLRKEGRDGIRQRGSDCQTISRTGSLVAGVIGLILLLSLDQLSKLAVSFFLKGSEAFVLIPGVFELRYLENQGAAFGMLEHMQWIFILFALAVTAASAVFYLRMPKTAHYRPLRILCVVLGAGALGNMVDRIAHGYVIDFFYFKLIDFPIFNMADIYVCVSTAILLLLILFYYREEDFRV